MKLIEQVTAKQNVARKRYIRARDKCMSQTAQFYHGKDHAFGEVIKLLEAGSGG